MSVKTKAGKTTKVPKFKSEAEEAAWWDRNPDFIADQFEKAAKEGRILRGLPGRGATRSVTIRLAMKESKKSPKPSPQKWDCPTRRISRPSCTKLSNESAIRLGGDGKRAQNPLSPVRY